MAGWLPLVSVVEFPRSFEGEPTPEELATLASPGTYPVPPGRGRWRFTVHARRWNAGDDWRTTMLAELTDARVRRVEKVLNGRAACSFTIDGYSSQAHLITELASDICAWRWDDRAGMDRMIFRGIVDNAEDTITEEDAVVQFTAHNYLAMVDRRFITAPAGLTFTQIEQDQIIGTLATNASTITPSAGGASFDPGDNLQLQMGFMNPDGTTRPQGSGNVVRDRTYEPGKSYGEAINDMSDDINGFDYDLDHEMFAGWDRLRIWYPYQGTARDDVTLLYGSTVRALTRTVAASDYANYVRVIGATPSGGTTPLWAEAWNADANDVTRTPVGLWMRSENLTDVSLQPTLNDRARGMVDRYGLLVPSYAVTMRPDAYSWGFPNMGDTVPLIVQAGRLDVNTTVRVVGITWNIGDDGQEDVELTVGRPLSSLVSLLRKYGSNIDQLARR